MQRFHVSRSKPRQLHVSHVIHQLRFSFLVEMIFVLATRNTFTERIFAVKSFQNRIIYLVVS